jgi:tRNA-uridine 2-sulfurtransferase
LLRAVDHSKDQSYVLHVLTQDKLKHALFPIGDYPKPEIRAIAERFGLPTASRKDSQDLCFLAGEDYRNFFSAMRLRYYSLEISKHPMAK